MNETTQKRAIQNTQAKMMAPVMALLLILAMLGAAMVNAMPAHAYTVGSNEAKRVTYQAYLDSYRIIALSARAEPIPLHKGNYYTAIVRDSGKITHLKSSNKKVASATWEKGDGYLDAKYYINIKAKKSGKATISYKQHGKTKKFTVKVFKYKNPAKKLKVGKKNYARYFKNGSCLYNGGLEVWGKKKISVKAATGWWVKGIYVSGPNGMKCVSNGYRMRKSEMVDGVLFAQKGTGTKCMLWFFTGGDSLGDV